MRRSVRVFAFIMVAVVAGSAFAEDNLLKTYWNEQKNLPQAQLMKDRIAAQAGANKALVGMEFGTVSRELLEKAEPDECFTAIGGPSSALPCADPARPKVNGGYVWGMVDVGNDVWFGTVANTHCIVASTMIGQALGGTLPPIETNSWVCEFGGGTWDPFGDQRPPALHAYRSATGTLDDLTAGFGAADLTALGDVVGIRAAGTQDGVVLFSGPTVNGDVNMFAFATDGTYLGFQTFPTWTDTRRFANLNGTMYLGIGVLPEPPNFFGGMVMRWTGSAASPFDFEMVTAMPGEMVAEVVTHEGRLAAGTWAVPQVLGPMGETAGVYISPDPGGDGILTVADGPWNKFWQAGDYDPNQVNSLVTGIGAMASFGGDLYWGTMHPPFLAMAAHYGFYSTFYSDISSAGYLEEFLLTAFLGTHRATSLWLGENLATSPNVEMLYGLPALPFFNPGIDPIPPDPVITDYWTIVDTGWIPLWGISGFGNLFNNYTWSMTVHNGRLWVGTMDMLYLLQDAGVTLLEGILDSQGITMDDVIAELIALGYLDPMMVEALQTLLSQDDMLNVAGADLYYFPLPDGPAYPESLSGIDNFTSYGVRNMRSVGDSIYVGMANPMNLLTDTSDDLPEGGWELIRLEDEPPNTRIGPSRTVTTEDGLAISMCNILTDGYTVGMRVPLAGLPMLIPPPEGYLPSPDVYLIGSSAQSAGCGGDTMATICAPTTAYLSSMFQATIIDDPVAGPIPGWMDITTSVTEGEVCGELQLADQDIMWALGYNGYMGMVTVLAAASQPIPASGPIGQVALVLLIAAAAVIVIRMRMG